jgi:glycerol-3-phosphate acyltransferase PlsY
MPWIILAITISYLIGSIPTAYIFGRLLKGIDIRNFGSGNVGATNAMRVLGKPAGISVLLIDILKGFLVVVGVGAVFAPRISIISSQTLSLILGLAAICGHNWTIFLGFRGGKGVATTFGVLLGLALKIPGLYLIILLLVLVWVVVFAVARIISVASVITALALPIFIFYFRPSRALWVLSLLLSLIVILRHKSNLKRVFRGEEKRFF